MRTKYFFSDSIFFVQKEGEERVELGDFLGDWTDEIEKDYGEGAKITEFVSTGAKSYAYTVTLPNGEVLYYI